MAATDGGERPSKLSERGEQARIEWKGKWGCFVAGIAEGAWGRTSWAGAGSGKLVSAF